VHLIEVLLYDQAVSFGKSRRAMNITTSTISGELIAFSGGGERERSLALNDTACNWLFYLTIYTDIEPVCSKMSDQIMSSVGQDILPQTGSILRDIETENNLLLTASTPCPCSLYYIVSKSVEQGDGRS